MSTFLAYIYYIQRYNKTISPNLSFLKSKCDNLESVLCKELGERESEKKCRQLPNEERVILKRKRKLPWKLGAGPITDPKLR